MNRYTVALPSQTVTMIAPPTSGDTEENLSHEEQLRRERQRQVGRRVGCCCCCYLLLYLQ